jgi:Arc/MetJ family transcription regulator
MPSGHRTRSSRIRATASSARRSRVGKVRKAFWLDPRLLAEARASLGVSTEREAVEMALDLVRFRKELGRAAQALRGLTLSRID